jgi:hypothetical protein
MAVPELSPELIQAVIDALTMPSVLCQAARVATVWRGAVRVKLMAMRLPLKIMQVLRGLGGHVLDCPVSLTVSADDYGSASSENGPSASGSASVSHATLRVVNQPNTIQDIFNGSARPYFVPRAAVSEVQAMVQTKTEEGAIGPVATTSLPTAVEQPPVMLPHGVHPHQIASHGQHLLFVVSYEGEYGNCVARHGSNATQHVYEPEGMSAIGGIAVHGDTLFVTVMKGRVDVVDANTLQVQFSFTGEGHYKLICPKSIALSTDELYVVDAGPFVYGARISAFTHGGAFLRHVRQPDPHLPHPLNAPAVLLSRLHFDALAYGHGHLYALRPDGTVLTMTDEGVLLQSFQMAAPGVAGGNQAGMAVHANYLYVTRAVDMCVHVLTAGYGA